MGTLQMSDPDLWHVASDDIADNVDYRVAIDAARRAAVAHASGGLEVRRLSIPVDNGWMRVMAATIPTLGVFGYKEFHLCDGKAVRYSVHVFDIATGRPIGIVDAALVTTMRTAATAAVAVERLAGTGASVRLGVVGTGAEALAGVTAFNAVVKLDEVRATSRQESNRSAFVDSVRHETGLDVRPCASLAEALDGADVVFVATNSGGSVVLRRGDLADVPLVASIGSTLPIQRELDGDVLRNAGRVVVDTMDVLHESGDAIAARELGWQTDQVELLGATLSSNGSASTGGQTVYKSIGSPEQDVVLAAAILDAAAVNGFGRQIPPLSAVKVNL